VSRVTDEPGFGKETHSTYEPLPEEILARRVTDPHTPPDSAGAPDVSTLVKTIRNGIPDDYRGPDPNDLDGEKWGPDPEVLAALDDLAATAREAEKRAGDSHEVMVRVWADRDRLDRRVAELEQELAETKGEAEKALNNAAIFIADWRNRVAELEAALEDAERRLVELDVHAASGDSVDDIRAARQVEKQLALQIRLAIRSVLAEDGGGA
jgi:hypothetical protein